MGISYVDLETAKKAEGLRLVLLKGVPSPWSQAAKAIVEIKGIEALGLWTNAADRAVLSWTGVPNAPVALYAKEPPRSGWADILALAERLQPDRALVPQDVERRIRMFGLCHELMGQQGLLWSFRLMAVNASLETEGARGFSVSVARYLGERYGYSPGCAAHARERAISGLRVLAEQLGRGLETGGPYYFGAELTALDIYSAAAMDTIAPLPPEQCPMHPRAREAFESRRDELRDALPETLVAHRDTMHRLHMPLPIAM